MSPVELRGTRRHREVAEQRRIGAYSDTVVMTFSVTRNVTEPFKGHYQRFKVSLFRLLATSG